METEELDTGSKGKAGELLVIGELLQRGYKVYVPEVDTGIDCLVDVGGGNYKEIQIKYREDEPIFNARKFQPRDNFYIACYLSNRWGRSVWIIPSRTYFSKSKLIKVRGKDYLQLRIGKEGSSSFKELAEFQNFGSLLSGATPGVKKKVSQASKRVEGPHLKQPDFEKEILTILSHTSTPMTAKAIVSSLQARMGAKFSPADMEPGKYGRIRWENNARFAIYQRLKKKGLIEDLGKNQLVITQKGKELIGSGG